MSDLTPDMILVMLAIGVAIFLFVVEWVRVDVVAILIMVVLPLIGLVTPAEAFSGLSSNAVVSIIAVIIIGAGLNKTGVVNNLVKPVLKVAGDGPSRVVIAISVTVAGISSFMQNIGAAALFLPAIQRIGKRLGIPVSQMLMPIGFSAILGGTMTLVGCSPLILLNDLLKPFDLEPFQLFDVTPIGVALVGSGIACFVFFGRFILPKTAEAEPSGKSASGAAAGAVAAEGSEKKLQGGPGSDDAQAWELHTSSEFTDYREPVTVDYLRERYLVNVLAVVEPPDYKVFSPPGEKEILSNVDLVTWGHRKDVERMADKEGMSLKPALEAFASFVSEQKSGTVEAVVAPRSKLAGKTLKEIDFEDRSRVTPMTISRHGETFRSAITEIPLRVGDVLQLHGKWRNLRYLQSDGNLLFTLPVETEEIQSNKALLAGFWLTVALTMVIVFKIQLSVCLMTGALGMIITRVLSIDEAYQSVDWRTIFLLGGLIPLGVATQRTGTAAWIANSILDAIGTVPPIVLISVIGALSTFFTLVISNVGATVLLVPLVVNMAISANVDPRMAALAVGLATSNSFILPTHQVNALYMGPGGYRSVDFIRAGSVMTVIFLAVMVSMMYFIYGI